MKRYVHEKIAFIQKSRPNDQHLLIVPGAKDEIISAPQSRIYTIRSPIISRSAKYRLLLNLRALDQIIAREKPDIIESADPYQIGWRAVRIGAAQRVPVVAFYHSNFTESYLRGPSRMLGQFASNQLMQIARAYVRTLYNRFETTLVPSAGLLDLLGKWGVRNTRQVALGVNTEIFHLAADAASTRSMLGITEDRTLLLYIGRLSPEKNTSTLFEAFAKLHARDAKKFHLLVVGEGQERGKLQALKDKTGQVTWVPYCADAAMLAQYYRAADLFVHPGVEETFGLVAVESQACGTPVVGIRGSFMDAVIVHDQSDWSNSNSAVALADAIEKMSGRDLSEMGRIAAARAAEQFAWPHLFADIFGVYGDVIRNFRGR